VAHELGRLCSMTCDPPCACCTCRVLKLLERAPRSIRLVSDSEPLDVVYECSTLLAVNKPPGLRSAPVHRFMGGSAVNRMIGYLGAEPYLVHRCVHQLHSLRVWFEFCSATWQCTGGARTFGC
jgi:hypothetical protein